LLLNKCKILSEIPFLFSTKRAMRSSTNLKKAIKDTVEDAQIALERNDFEKTKQLVLDKGMDLLQGCQKINPNPKSHYR